MVTATRITSEPERSARPAAAHVEIPDRRLHQIAAVFRAQPKLNGPGVLKQLAHDPVETRRSSKNLLDQSVPRVVLVDIAFKQGREAPNPTERVADFVGHRRRHLPDGGQTVLVAHFLP